MPTTALPPPAPAGDPSFWRSIFEALPAAVYTCDIQGRVTAFNRAAESITGVAEKEALGQPWEALFGREVDLKEAREGVEGPGGQSRRACE